MLRDEKEDILSAAGVANVERMCEQEIDFEITVRGLWPGDMFDEMDDPLQDDNG